LGSDADLLHVDDVVVHSAIISSLEVRRSSIESAECSIDEGERAREVV
jgi:hypothetical protein